MMRFGRISAVLAMLVFQPVAAVQAGDVSFIRVDTNNSSAGTSGGVNADGETDGYGDDDSQLWASATSLELAVLGPFESSATLSTLGYVNLTCPAHCYVCEGECGTMEAWCLIIEEALTSMEVASEIGAVGASTGHTIQLENDGDSVQENATLLGTINIKVELSQIFGYGDCAVWINAPGISGGAMLAADGNGNVVANGEFEYTDTNGQQQTISYINEVFPATGTIDINVNVRAVLAEGSQFTVSYGGQSDTDNIIWGDGNVGGQLTTMVNWAYSASAP